MTTTLVQIDVEREIQRLQRTQIVELEQVRSLHEWLDNQRISRQPGRIVGESRTGKTCGVKSYLQNHPPSQVGGQTPVVPIVYLLTHWKRMVNPDYRERYEGMVSN